MNIKLITVTWSNEDTFDIENTTLYKSFKRYNPHKEVVHHHFNRGHFHQEESNFRNRFGNESEYLLYKIHLWRGDITRTLFCYRNKSFKSDQQIIFDENHVFIV